MNVDSQPDTYLKIDREWKDGDQLTLNLPMELSSRTWQANQNSVSVNYGPLTFSLKIDEDYEKISSTASAIHDSKWQKDADPEKWPAYMIEPTSDWNYGLLLDDEDLSSSFTVVKKAWPADNYPFSEENVPIKLRPKGRKFLDGELINMGW